VELELRDRLADRHRRAPDTRTSAATARSRSRVGRRPRNGCRGRAGRRRHSEVGCAHAGRTRGRERLRGLRGVRWEGDEDNSGLQRDAVQRGRTLAVNCVAETQAGEHNDRPVERHPRPQVVAERAVVGGRVGQRAGHGAAEEEVAVRRRHALTPAQPSELRQVDHRQQIHKGGPAAYGASESRLRPATDAVAHGAA
jgi:hypothetical protein